MAASTSRHPSDAFYSFVENSGDAKLSLVGPYCVTCMNNDHRGGRFAPIPPAIFVHTASEGMHVELDNLEKINGRMTPFLGRDLSEQELLVLRCCHRDCKTEPRMISPCSSTHASVPPEPLELRECAMSLVKRVDNELTMEKKNNKRSAPALTKNRVMGHNTGHNRTRNKWKNHGHQQQKRGGSSSSSQMVPDIVAATLSENAHLNCGRSKHSGSVESSNFKPAVAKSTDPLPAAAESSVKPPTVALPKRQPTTAESSPPPLLHGTTSRFSTPLSDIEFVGRSDRLCLILNHLTLPADMQALNEEVERKGWKAADCKVCDMSDQGSVKYLDHVTSFSHFTRLADVNLFVCAADFNRLDTVLMSIVKRNTHDEGEVGKLRLHDAPFSKTTLTEPSNMNDYNASIERIRNGLALLEPNLVSKHYVMRFNPVTRCDVCKVEVTSLSTLTHFVSDTHIDKIHSKNRFFLDIDFRNITFFINGVKKDITGLEQFKMSKQRAASSRHSSRKTSSVSNEVKSATGRPRGNSQSTEPMRHALIPNRYGPERALLASATPATLAASQRMSKNHIETVLINTRRMLPDALLSNICNLLSMNCRLEWVSLCPKVCPLCSVPMNCICRLIRHIFSEEHQAKLTAVGFSVSHQDMTTWILRVDEMVRQFRASPLSEGVKSGDPRCWDMTNCWKPAAPVPSPVGASGGASGLSGASTASANGSADARKSSDENPGCIIS